MPAHKLNYQTIADGVTGVFAIAGMILLSPLLRTWYSRWGVTDDELLRSIPGDEIVPYPKSEVNCAITINASASQIWPWFVQLGCQRGGWYSYDLLDNGGVASADSILPEHQQLQVGDFVKAVPNGSFGFPVAALQPERALILGGVINTRTGTTTDLKDSDLQSYFAGLQTFLLDEIGERNTRLLFHCRMDWNPSLLNGIIMRGILEPVTFVMGRKMLLNLKHRIEAQASLSGRIAPTTAA
jgi:hypothetical protein